MSGIGTVTFETITHKSQSVSFDESVSGMLFDCAYRQNVFSDYPLASHFFKNGDAVLINGLAEAEAHGITSDFMNGIPYYHIKKYYEYIGVEAKLYLSFFSCIQNGEPNFEIIENIQQQVGGTMFQLGIWTEQFLWNCSDVNYGFTNLLGSIQARLNNLSGNGVAESESFPMSVILFPNTAMAYGETDLAYTIDINKIPEALDLGFHGISVVLGQNGDDEVHSMQEKNIAKCPVGMMGYVMAILNLASAEISIGSVLDFDLNKNEDFLNPELGFGSITDENRDYSPISEINRMRRNVLSLKGYIIPISYKAKEAQYFLSNDQTLSVGDYSTISNNRVINKCKRIIRSVLLPKIKSNYLINPSTGQMSDVESAAITSEILNKIDDFMVNKKNLPQIYGRLVSVTTDSDFADSDKISVNVTIVSKYSSSEINFKDEYYTNE